MFVWGISIAIVGLIDPQAAYEGIVKAINEKRKHDERTIRGTTR